MMPPALVELKASRVITLVRTPAGRRSSTCSPAVLRQLGDGVGCVVGAHAGDDLGDLCVGLVLEEPVGDVGVQLLEYICLELGVAVHDIEDLFSLLAGCVLEQVGYLSRFEPPDPTEAGSYPHAGGVADERLERLPVLAGVPAPGADEAEQARRPPGVQAAHDPSLAGGLQLDVPRPDQLGVRNVDEAVPQDVLSQQNLPLPALETPEIHFGLRQLHPLLAERGDPVGGDENRPATHLEHQPCDQGKLAASKANYHVVDLADALVGGGEHVTAKQRRQVHKRDPNPNANRGLRRG